MPQDGLTALAPLITEKGRHFSNVMADAEGRQTIYLAEKLPDEGGEIRRYVNIFVNDEDIRFLDGKDTPLNDGDNASIVPAIAGGR